MTAALTERMPAAQLIGQANDLFSRFMDKTELNFRWLQEILVEAKESFQQPEAVLLPKTPCTKRPTRRCRQKHRSTAASEMSEESRGGNTKWKRTARGSKVVTMADNSSADSADPESEEPVASGKGRKKKSSNSHRKLSNSSISASTSVAIEITDGTPPKKKIRSKNTIEEIVLKPNTTPRRSNVAETTAVIHPADPTGHPRVSLRRSLIKPVETFTTPSRDVPDASTATEQAEPSPAPLISQADVKSQLKYLCEEIVHAYPPINVIPDTPQVETSERKISNFMEVIEFPSPPSEMEMQEKSVDMSLISNISETDMDDSSANASKRGRSLRGVAKHSISIAKSSRRSSVMSKSTRMSVANSKVQKAKLSMAAQMVLNDELTLQIEKLQPAVDKSELLDEEPKESPLVSQNENDACDEDMPEENLKEKTPPKPVRTRTRATNNSTSTNPSPMKSSTPVMRITRTKQRKIDAEAIKTHDVEPAGSGLPPKHFGGSQGRDPTGMHSKLRDIQEKLDKVKRQPVNSPSRTNTSVRSYAMKTPSPAKRGPVIASGVKGGQSSSSKSIARPMAILGSIFKQRTTPGNLVTFTNPLATKSFIKTPQKTTQTELDLQRKAEQLKLQEQRQQEASQKKEEMIRQRIEEQKRKREERMQKVAQSKEQKEREHEEQLKKKMEKQASTSSLKSEEEQKRKLKLIKEAEAKRRAEEERQRTEEIQRKQREEEEYRRQLQEQQRQQKEKEAELRQQLKEKEKQRLMALQAAKAASKQAAAQKPTTSATILNKSHNATVTLNSSQSYDMTPNPRPKKVAPSTETNYNIDDLNSEDETDDEDNPRKKIPKWAEGFELKSALIAQWHKPVDVLDDLFGGMLLPDLSKIFKVQRKRFKNRTSSQFWSSPIWKSTHGFEV